MNGNMRCVRMGMGLAGLLALLSFPLILQGQAQTPVDKFRRVENPIRGTYVVVLRSEMAGSLGATSLAPVLAPSLAAAYGGTLLHVYDYVLNGFSVQLDEAAAIALSQDPSVEYVQENGLMWTTQSQPNPPWGLDRIDQRDRPLDNRYDYNTSGAGVNIYVIDTGIRLSHTDFDSRARFGVDFAPGGDGTGRDCNGHGTHVAGTAGGRRYGVAKDATLYSVRVMGVNGDPCSNSGESVNVIAGVNWVTANRRLPAVANMSLGGANDLPLDTAVRNSIAAGVTYVVSAGNADVAVTTETPASVGPAITVGATQDISPPPQPGSDERWRDLFFGGGSNFGPLLDLFAPGAYIYSAGHRFDNDVAVLSGTSMAAPHVAGAAARFLQTTPGAPPALVERAIVMSATAGRIRPATIGAGSPNLLLFTTFTTPPPPPICLYTVAPLSATFPLAGGPGTVNITTAPALGCPWVAVSYAPWVAINAGAGFGTGVATYSVAPNPGGARSGMMAVAGRIVTVTQAGCAAPSTTTQPASQTISPGQQATLSVAAQGPPPLSYQWYRGLSGDISNPIAGATSSTYLTPPLTNTTNYWVRVTNACGSVDSVTAVVSVVCTYAISPTSRAHAAAGSPGTVSVMTAGSCSWLATSQASWITVTAGASGTGAGTVSYLVSANPSAAGRTGTLIVATRTFTITQAGIPPLTYYLAEGATGSFFDLDVAVANPGLTAAPIQLTYLKDDGTTVTHSSMLPPLTRRTVRVDEVPNFESGAVSTIVESTNALPLVVERTLFWDSGWYGGHTAGAVDTPRTRWYFAEGSQGMFDTYVLLANPNSAPSTVTVRFLLELEAPLVRTFVVNPMSRFTLFAGSLPELVGKSFAIVIDSTLPVIAERSMYFGVNRFWEAGHASAGVPAPATSWFHAEGATGPFLDTYILVANPNPTAATVTFTYLLPSGASIVRARSIPANRRLTVEIEQEDPLLANAAVSTMVISDVPVISERAVYWGGSFPDWTEAHNSFGLTETATRWGLAEGRVGGPQSFETYILLANTTALAAQVQVTFLRTDGTTVIKSYNVAPTSRFNIFVNSMVPELADEHFGVVIQSTNGVPIVVERSMYWNALGQIWAGGTNATAIKLP